MVVGTNLTFSVAVESGERIKTARDERSAENIFVFHDDASFEWDLTFSKSNSQKGFLRPHRKGMKNRGIRKWSDQIGNLFFTRRLVTLLA